MSVMPWHYILQLRDYASPVSQAGHTFVGDLGSGKFFLDYKETCSRFALELSSALAMMVPLHFIRGI